MKMGGTTTLSQCRYEEVGSNRGLGAYRVQEKNRGVGALPSPPHPPALLTLKLGGSLPSLSYCGTKKPVLSSKLMSGSRWDIHGNTPSMG